MILSGCSNPTKPPEQVCPEPPTVFYQQTPVPEFEGETYRDMAKFTGELKNALAQCNLDKNSTFEFYKGSN